MKQQLEDEAELRQYLLGELAQEERVLIEKRLFLDGDYLLQLKAVEDDLIDDYAYDELTASEREKFETHLISKPGRQEDLRIAKALKRYIASDAELVAPPIASDAPSAAGEVRKHSWPGGISFLPDLFMRRPVAGSALAAVALVVLSLIIWFSVESLREKDDPARRMQAQESTPQPTKPPEQQQLDPGKILQPKEQPADEGREVVAQEGAPRKDAKGGEKEKLAERRAGQQSKSTPPTPRTPAQVATFLILPGGGVRGEGQTGKVRFSSDVGTVILRVPLVTENDYHSYHATLQTGGGRALHTHPGLQPEIDAEYGSVIVFKVPAKLLRPGSYQVKLGGVNAAGQTQDIKAYPFQVEKQ
jgi:hypothetical protein